jgi:predicted metallo-beta-lactamase superfamily hydrolase
MRLLMTVTSDGSSASYYKLPPESSEWSQLQDIISWLNLNAQIGEIMRATFRYGKDHHSSKLRDIRKIIFYAKAEEARLINYEDAQ